MKNLRHIANAPIPVSTPMWHVLKVICKTVHRKQKTTSAEFTACLDPILGTGLKLALRFSTHTCTHCESLQISDLETRGHGNWLAVPVTYTLVMLMLMPSYTKTTRKTHRHVLKYSPEFTLSGNGRAHPTNDQNIKGPLSGYIKMPSRRTFMAKSIGSGFHS
ncbi:hypothetical protein CBL_03078 [Carabus blaptoides fortunei]